MKRALIIGHFWPYCRGSKRVIGLAKFFSEFGWEPIILTGPLIKIPDSHFRFIETECQGFLGSAVRLFGLKPEADLSTQLQAKVRKTPAVIKTVSRFLYCRLAEIFAYPDEYKKWKTPALKAARNYIEKERVDAIISVWPVTSHIIAKELKEKYKIPWVADFPDLWSQNYNSCYSLVRRCFERKLEIKALLSADVLVTVSQPMAEKLQELHTRKEIYVITHGFDLKRVNDPPTKLTDKFTITYTGQIYTGKQDPLKILIALKDLIKKGIIDINNIEVRFYGPRRNWLEEATKKINLSEIVKQYGQIDYEDSIKKQQESQLLLLLNWEDKTQKGVYTGKIFEYLAAKRPILASGGYRKDVVEKLLVETKAGVFAPGITDIKNCLKDFYLEYKREGKVIYKGEWEEISKYSQKEMAKKFAEILNQIS